jgi:hypothetical protein
VRLTTSHRKTLLLRNLNRGGQGPIWAVAPLNGWMTFHLSLLFKRISCARLRTCIPFETVDVCHNPRHILTWSFMNPSCSICKTLVGCGYTSKRSTCFKLVRRAWCFTAHSPRSLYFCPSDPSRDASQLDFRLRYTIGSMIPAQGFPACSQGSYVRGYRPTILASYALRVRLCNVLKFV